MVRRRRKEEESGYNIVSNVVIFSLNLLHADHRAYL